MSTEELLEAFAVHSLAAGRSTGTVYVRRGMLNRLAVEHPDLAAVTPADLEAYLAARRTVLSAATRRSLLATFRTFYRWCATQGVTETDIAAGLGNIRSTQTRPRIALNSAVIAAIENASARDRAIILLGRLACLRRSEIAALHTRQRERDILRIVGKGDKQRLVPVNPELMPSLLELEETRAGGFYFPGGTDGHINPGTVNHVISRLVGTNPHSLRHAGATASYQATGDLRALQEMLGHSSLATTQVYLHTSNEALRRAAAGTSLGFGSAA